MWCFSLSLLKGRSSTDQEPAPSQALQVLRSKVDRYLNSGHIDSLEFYASQGKQQALAENDQEQLVYFNYILGASMQTQNPEKASLYLDTALDLSLTAKYGLGQLLVYDARSNMLRKAGRYDSALQFSEMSRELIRDMSDSKRKSTLLCSSYSTAGLIYLRIGDYPKALEFLYKAHTLALKEGLTSRLYYYKENIAGINMQLGNYDQAIPYFKEVAHYADSVDNQSLQATSLLALGQIAKQQQRLNESLGFYKEALKLSAVNQDIEKFDLYYELARLYLAMDLSDSSVYYFNQAEAVIPVANQKFRSDLRQAKATDYLCLSGQDAIRRNLINYTPAPHFLKIV